MLWEGIASFIYMETLHTPSHMGFGVTEEDLSPDYEPEPDDVVYTLKPVNGRFKVNCPSQIDIFNLQEGNRSQRQGSQRRPSSRPSILKPAA
jgi:hypothetical protein